MVGFFWYHRCAAAAMETWHLKNHALFFTLGVLKSESMSKSPAKKSHSINTVSRKNWLTCSTTNKLKTWQTVFGLCKSLEKTSTPLPGPSTKGTLVQIKSICLWWPHSMMAHNICGDSAARFPAPGVVVVVRRWKGLRSAEKKSKHWFSTIYICTYIYNGTSIYIIKRIYIYNHIVIYIYIYIY